jgi:hypothetical protein
MTAPLSVVVATTQPWPEIAPCLDSLREDAEALGAEIIVADGDGAGLGAGHGFSRLRHIVAPGRSVFELRGLGIAVASGPVVAITEDHCVVGDRWLSRVLDAHRAQPTAAAIGGVVENGATGRLIDWANFLIIFAPVLAPLSRGRGREISLQANISYKRDRLPPPDPDKGIMEMLLNRALVERGEVVAADDGLVVRHVQSHGWAGTLAAHFHNGRSIAGYRLASLTPAWRAARLASCALLPAHLTLRVVRAIAPKRRLYGITLAALPIVALLACCHATGELVGYLAGPGRSPHRLR